MWGMPQIAATESKGFYLMTFLLVLRTRMVKSRNLFSFLFIYVLCDGVPGLVTLNKGWTDRCVCLHHTSLKRQSHASLEDTD